MQSKQQTSHCAAVIGLIALPFVVLTFFALLPFPNFFRWREGELWPYYDTSRKLTRTNGSSWLSAGVLPLALLPVVCSHLVAVGQFINFHAYAMVKHAIRPLIGLYFR